ncbi:MULTISPECIES: class F sortase [unclassified Rhodococcus (in: high G+C Gram-positive bacteria)]|uniref:class F sortase n=1 Tax=unclassified Rhodococcus (in: high G+C Gram-positive bacteria) TaxID=192944 RepID=UPI0024B75E45|nr:MULTISPECIES: class F sortase [unclassified Rhodococcus (in: high G+C Gram-positive bacteria)]MDI9956727.1 class F sortase [Rhodococcus sp. IEGM 1237]MDI9962733.1 class F sortase [Rhodococcus sp. IEGM 1251]MDV8128918.1 class F sortase [Rhodococcus sp. IEGM 1304]
MTMYESDPNPSNPYDDPNDDRPANTGKGRRVAYILAVVAVLVAGAFMAFVGLRSSDDSGAIPLSPGVVMSHSANPAAPTDELMTPNTLSLDPVGVQAPIVDATVPEGVLTPPENVKNVGIWLDGASLDSATGTTLIAGHVNLTGQGNGALFDLGTIEPGEVIRTSDATGKSTSWKVTAVTTRPKADGVEESVLAGPEGPRKLAVVTCGGELQFEDGVGNYADNVYLYADLMV